jgi:hypothetical protein
MLSFNQLTGVWVSDNNGNTTIGTSSSANTNPRLPASPTGAQNNSAVGYGALKNNQTGKCNIAMGINALNTNLAGNDNIAIGANALFNPTTYAVQTGNSNIAIGSNALGGNTGGNNNVAVGSATNSNNYSNCILLGNGASANDNDELGFGGLNTWTSGSSCPTQVDKFLKTSLTGGNNPATYYLPLFTNANSFETTPPGTNWGDYLFWAPNGVPGSLCPPGPQWAVGDTNITIGGFAGETGQQLYAVALGYQAGQTGGQTGAVAVGYQAGQIGQGASAVAIGKAAGLSIQGLSAVAIGNAAGNLTQSQYAVAIGSAAGSNSQQQYAVAVGAGAGFTTQSQYAVAIGASAGETTQSQSAVAIGLNAGNANQQQFAVAIGDGAGLNNQQQFAVAVGSSAGSTGQGDSAVAVGYKAGQTGQGASAVAVGFNAGNSTQQQLAVAIGAGAGQTNQRQSTVAIGSSAGNANQQQFAVAIGFGAGQSTQNQNSVAVGLNAGQTTQGQSAVAIGDFAGNSTQGASAVAIGFQAGQTGQGEHAIAIGHLAGATGQFAGSIVLNASGVALNAGETGFFVDPIRTTTGVSGFTGSLWYNPTTHEVGLNAKMIPDGTVYGEYLYWDPAVNNWVVGGQDINIGWHAGEISQGANAVALGNDAGRYHGGTGAVAVGYQAGSTGQGTSAVAIGASAGSLNQGPTGAVAIGASAGQYTQGASAVAVGYQAGFTGQGANAIAIGNQAGATGQFGGSIVLNASGVAFQAGQTGFFVDPIRVAPTNPNFGFQFGTTGAPSGTANTLYWDSATKEMLYAPGANVVRIEAATYSLQDPQFAEQVVTIIKTVTSSTNVPSVVSTANPNTTKIKNQTGVHTSVTMEGPYSAMTLIAKQKSGGWTWDIVSSIGTITTDLPVPEVIIANNSANGVGLLIGIPAEYNTRLVTTVVIKNIYNGHSVTLTSPSGITVGGGWPTRYYVFYERSFGTPYWDINLASFTNYALPATYGYTAFDPPLCQGLVFGNASLTFTVTELSELEPHVLTCKLPALSVGDGYQYQQYNAISAQQSQFAWGTGGGTNEDWGTQTGAPQPETYGQWKLGTIIGPSTGTVGGILGPGPWTADITVTSTTGIVVGQTLSATNGPGGIGSLYGGNPASVIVNSIVPNTSISYTVTGGTIPVAGPITDIIATEPPPSSYSQQSIYKQLYPNNI